MGFLESFNNAKHYVFNNASSFLTGGSIVLTVLTVVEAVHATRKANDIIDELKYEKFEALGCPEDENINYDLTVKETVSSVWPCYIWTGLLLTCSIVCGVASHYNSNKKIQALTLAYGSTLELYNMYKDNVEKVVKDKDLRLINHGVVHDIVEKDKKVLPEHTKNILYGVTDDTMILFRDLYSSKIGKGYFKRTAEDIRRAEGRFNRLLIENRYATLNDWYDCLDIGHSELGDTLGWRFEETGPLFATPIPDDFNIVEDVAVVTGLGLGKYQHSRFIESPKTII